MLFARSKTWMACFSGSVAGVLGLTGLDGFFFYVVAQLVRPSRHRPAQPCSRLIGAALAAGVLGAAREDGDGYQAMCAAAPALRLCSVAFLRG